MSVPPSGMRGCQGDAVRGITTVLLKVARGPVVECRRPSARDTTALDRFATLQPPIVRNNTVAIVGAVRPTFTLS